MPTVYPCCDDPSCPLCHGSGVYYPTPSPEDIVRELAKWYAESRDGRGPYASSLYDDTRTWGDVVAEVAATLP